MTLRVAACGTMLTLGLLAVGPAAAQPYPMYGPPYGPPGYGPYYGPPRAYVAPRPVPPYPPPAVLAEDELPPGEIPGVPSSSVAGPYPVGPAQPSPYTGSVPAAGPESPAPYGAAPSAAYPAGPGPGPNAAYPRSLPPAAYPSAPAATTGAPSAAYPSAPGAATGTLYPQDQGPAAAAPAGGNPQYDAPNPALRPPVEIDPSRRQVIAALPPEEQPEAQPKELPAHLRRQLVDYVTKEPAGTIIVDTPNTFLYVVLGHSKAMRYGIGVGREGFTWTGVERVSKMTEWPDWYPPNEMIDRQPYLPRMMAGGPGNPLGARALYLGKSLYRIHGTNQPSTIGKFVSSGCIRLLNEDIEDLYGRVTVGTRVVVLPGSAPGPSASAQPPAAPPHGQPSVR